MDWRHEPYSLCSSISSALLVTSQNCFVFVLYVFSFNGKLCLFPIVQAPFHVLVPVQFPCSVNEPVLYCTNKNSSTKNGYVCGDMKFEQSTVVSFVNAHRKLPDISFNCNRYLATSATEYVCVLNHHLGIATLEF